MITYEVENDEENYIEIDVKTHTLRVMRMLQENVFKYFRINASTPA